MNACSFHDVQLIFICLFAKWMVNLSNVHGKMLYYALNCLFFYLMRAIVPPPPFHCSNPLLRHWVRSHTCIYVHVSAKKHKWQHELTPIRISLFMQHQRQWNVYLSAVFTCCCCLFVLVSFICSVSGVRKMWIISREKQLSIHVGLQSDMVWWLLNKIESLEGGVCLNVPYLHTLPSGFIKYHCTPKTASHHSFVCFVTVSVRVYGFVD